MHVHQNASFPKCKRRFENSCSHILFRKSPAPRFALPWQIWTAIAATGCQMVYFQTKRPNLGKFWRDLEWKMLIYFIVFWNILRSCDVSYGHLVFGIGNFPPFWYIASRKIWQPCQGPTFNTLSSVAIFSVKICQNFSSHFCAKGKGGFCS
jgi:hypothetical protein